MGLDRSDSSCSGNGLEGSGVPWSQSRSEGQVVYALQGGGGQRVHCLGNPPSSVFPRYVNIERENPEKFVRSV